MPLAEQFGINDLARWLGLDAREVTRLVSRGKLPARRVGGEWRFQRAEITRWIETELQISSSDELVRFEQSPIALQSTLHPAGGSMTDHILLPECIAFPLQARTKGSVLRELVQVAGNSFRIWDPDTVLSAVEVREERSSTAMGMGIAFPHPGKRLTAEISESAVSLGVSLGGIPFGAPDGKLTQVFFLVLATDDATHLSILARLSRLFRADETLAEQILACGDSHQTHEFLRKLELGFLGDS